LGSLLKLKISHRSVETYNDLKTPEFLKLNPLGQSPTLQVGEDQAVWQTTPIFRYLARLAPETGYIGTNLYQNGLIDQWSDFFQC